MNERPNEPGGAMSVPSVVHVVVPNNIDNPNTPSGGNVYDRRLCHGLAAAGWEVHEHPAWGAWPSPDGSARADLARLLARLPDGATVLVDGLVASAVPEIMKRQARRLQTVALVHMPLGDGRERDALSAMAAVLTTSPWTRRRLLEWYALPASQVHVAEPGVDPAPLVPGSDSGSELLCVAAVTVHKGHDLLIEALAHNAALPWRCVCVGSLDRDPPFVERLRQRAQDCGIGDRVSFVGPRTGAELDASYAAADLVVLASRAETYGMVVTEALARGLPVLATATGGLPQAVGRAPDGSLPGILAAPDEPAAFADALRRWLGEPDLRHRLRRSARSRRTTLAGWAATAEIVSSVLSPVAARVGAAR